MSSSEQTDRPTLRTDAERNRVAIVSAARKAFAEHGLDVSLTEVARRAGVGIATLYRRFPTRESLIAGVFDDKMSYYLDAVEKALMDKDAWHGFCTYVEQVCAMQDVDRGFANVLTVTFPNESSFEGKRAAAYRGLRELIAKAKEVGRLRPDFESQDLVVLLMANAGVVASSGDSARVASRRLVSNVLLAFDTTHAHIAEPPPSKKEMEIAMRVRAQDALMSS